MRKIISEISIVLAGVGLSALSIFSIWFWFARLLYLIGFVVAVFVYLFEKDE